VTAHTKEMGQLPLYLIYEAQGLWEEKWRPLQGHPIAEAFTRVPKALVEHALHGWSSPLVKALGLLPAGCLRKLPVPARECEVRRKCPFYDKAQCFPTAKAMPWCYEPGGVEESIRALVSEAISLWREGVYITVVCEEER